MLGSALVGLARYAEAEPLLLQSYRALSGLPKAEEATAAALRRIVGLYESWKSKSPEGGEVARAV